MYRSFDFSYSMASGERERAARPERLFNVRSLCVFGEIPDHARPAELPASLGGVRRRPAEPAAGGGNGGDQNPPRLFFGMDKQPRCRIAPGVCGIPIVPGREGSACPLTTPRVGLVLKIVPAPPYFLYFLASHFGRRARSRNSRMSGTTISGRLTSSWPKPSTSLTVQPIRSSSSLCSAITGPIGVV
jgi:hypothetical protein